MKTNTKLPLIIPLVLSGLAPAGVALAHPGHPGPDGYGFMTGLIHPFTGADHMLAMFSVGLWAASRGSKAIWAWPTAFVTALIVGFALGKSGITMPLAEPAILASIIVLGGLTAANARFPTSAGVVLIAVFGAAHGYAHGAESPGSTIGFPIGMALTTVALHLAGIGAALALRKLERPLLVRLLGAAAMVGGVALAVTA